MSNFIVSEIANSKNDEFYTPAYAIIPLLRYLPHPSQHNPIIIWCPFDTEESRFVKVFRILGFQVVATHISEGKNFFKIEPPICDFIISNPPYSSKGEVLERLFKMNIPFAMLVGVVGLFESQKRFNMFKKEKFEIMYFNRRIAYLKSYDNKAPSLHPPFSSVYICKGILPKQIIFEEIDKGGKTGEQKNL